MSDNTKVGAGIVGIAKRTSIDLNKPIQLHSGYYALLHAVSASLIEDARSIIKDPPVPTFLNEDKGREEPNPNHPDYIKKLEENEQARNVAATEAMIMFGVTLCDKEGNPTDPPEEDWWVNRLKFMERRNFLSLEGYDLTEAVDREFLFKKYFAVSAPDLITLSKATQLDEAMVADAASTFQNN